MCWSGEASAVLATVGLVTTAYAAVKKNPPVLWMALGYFSLMELLQAYTYSVIDQCDDPGNQIATLLGYMHIAFQPFFINAISLYFVPEGVRKRIAIPAYTFCFFSVIFMMLQVYPFDWAGHCNPGRSLCGDVLCSFSGEWHIAWSVPTNSIGEMFYLPHVRLFFSGFFTYELAAFAIPLLYGSWRMTAYHFIVGPLLASQLTSNLNEFPAIWCLLSIGILLIVVKTPIRGYLHVKRWPLWPKEWLQDPKGSA